MCIYMKYNFYGITDFELELELGAVSISFPDAVSALDRYISAHVLDVRNGKHLSRQEGSFPWDYSFFILGLERK